MDISSDSGESRCPETIKNLENTEFYGFFAGLWKAMQESCSRSKSFLSLRFGKTIKFAFLNRNYGFWSGEVCFRAENNHKKSGKINFLWLLAQMPNAPPNAMKSEFAQITFMLRYNEAGKLH